MCIEPCQTKCPAKSQLSAEHQLKSVGDVSQSLENASSELPRKIGYISTSKYPLKQHHKDVIPCPESGDWGQFSTRVLILKIFQFA